MSYISVKNSCSQQEYETCYYLFYVKPFSGHNLFRKACIQHQKSTFSIFIQIRSYQPLLKTYKAPHHISWLSKKSKYRPTAVRSLALGTFTEERHSRAPPGSPGGRFSGIFAPLLKLFFLTIFTMFIYITRITQNVFINIQSNKFSSLF